MPAFFSLSLFTFLTGEVCVCHLHKQQDGCHVVSYAVRIPAEVDVGHPIMGRAQTENAASFSGWKRRRVSLDYKPYSYHIDARPSAYLGLALVNKL